jgi:hypothetical protein
MHALYLYEHGPPTQAGQVQYLDRFAAEDRFDIHVPLSKVLLGLIVLRSTGSQNSACTKSALYPVQSFITSTLIRQALGAWRLKRARRRHSTQGGLYPPLQTTTRWLLAASGWSGWEGSWHSLCSLQGSYPEVLKVHVPRYLTIPARGRWNLLPCLVMRKSSRQVPQHHRFRPIAAQHHSTKQVPGRGQAEQPPVRESESGRASCPALPTTRVRCCRVPPSNQPGQPNQPWLAGTILSIPSHLANASIDAHSRSFSTARPVALPDTSDRTDALKNCVARPRHGQRY